MSTITDLQTLINNNLESASNITAVELRAVFNSFLTTTAHLYEVKQLDVPTSFIADNFDGTGLGIDAYVGWAICNGNNGTLNRGGRVAIGYDETNYATLGATGGAETHTLTEAQIPSLDMTITLSNDDSTEGASDGSDRNYFMTTNRLEITPDKTFANKVNATGGGQAHNNMQPYLVTLFIQRIA